MAPAEPIVVVYVTAPDMATAKTIAQSLIAEKTAACVNIIPGMVSVYRWEGEVNIDDEVVLIIKTRQSLSERVIQDVVARHPYDVPAVTVLPVSTGHLDFFKWIGEETKPPNSDEC